MKAYRVFDIEDDEYLDLDGLYFGELQDLLFSKTTELLYPDLDAIEEMREKIHSASSVNELDYVIDGLNLKVEEEEVND